MTYITSKAPLFIHQFSHAWIDFRNKRDAFANYFTNSVTATRAHKVFCLSLVSQFPDYNDNFWGLSSSDNPRDYVAWGGPPAMGPIDGTIVPSAAGGSIPFLPDDTLAVLENIYHNFPAAWTRYGYVNAFNPLTGWYDPDVVGIGLGIVALMAENYRTQLVWKSFMKNSEITKAMMLAGFQPNGTSVAKGVSDATRSWAKLDAEQKASSMISGETLGRLHRTCKHQPTEGVSPPFVRRATSGHQLETQSVL